MKKENLDKESLKSLLACVIKSYNCLKEQLETQTKIIKDFELKQQHLLKSVEELKAANQVQKEVDKLALPEPTKKKRVIHVDSVEDVPPEISQRYMAYCSQNKEAI